MLPACSTVWGERVLLVPLECPKIEQIAIITRKRDTARRDETRLDSMAKRVQMLMGINLAGRLIFMWPAWSAFLMNPREPRRG